MYKLLHRVHTFKVAALFIVTLCFNTLLHAEMVDSKGRVIPSAGSTTSRCKSIYELNKNESADVIFAKQEAIWKAYVCLEKCDEERTWLQGNLIGKNLVDAHFYNRQEVTQLFVKFRRQCEKTLPKYSANAKVTDNADNSERECVRAEYLKHLYTTLNIDKNGQVELKRFTDKEFIDYYQICRHELERVVRSEGLVPTSLENIFE